MSQREPLLPIAVDVMGGDLGFEELANGARIAHEEFGVDCLIVGNQGMLQKLQGLSWRPGFEIVNADEEIDMSDSPSPSLRAKPKASVLIAAELVGLGKASAFISAGNSGACLGAATIKMGRLQGVDRAAIAVSLPSSPTPTVMLDAGANAQVQPEWLGQFAELGAAYSRVRFGIENPKVALLNIGGEPGKGHSLIREAFEHLVAVAPSSQFEFVGNIEGHQLLGGKADVVVCDGYVGNVALKTMEGTASFMLTYLASKIAQAFPDSPLGDLESLLRLFRDQLHAPEGGMLLGVRGLACVTHGAATAKEYADAIVATAALVERGLVSTMQEHLR